MPERDFDKEFRSIVESNFTDVTLGRESGIYEQQRALQEAEEEDMRWERVVIASYDLRIADYFLYGSGSEETLIVQLQRDYDLRNHQEAEEAIDRGIGQLHEVTDYGDET